MGARSQSASHLLSVAAAATFVVLWSMPENASATTGGTIHFSGAVVAPQFDIASAALTIAQQQGTSGRIAGNGLDAVVTFKSQNSLTSGANVALMVNDDSASSTDAAALESMTRVVDGAGRVTPPHKRGDYRIGTDGGVLSLEQRVGNVPSVQVPVTVVVSYD